MELVQEVGPVRQGDEHEVRFRVLIAQRPVSAGGIADGIGDLVAGLDAVLSHQLDDDLLDIGEFGRAVGPVADDVRFDSDRRDSVR